MRRTAGYTWADYKTNSHIAKELEITPVLDKLLEYKWNWIQHVNRMSRDRLPRIMKHYSPIGRRNCGRPLKRLLDTWDRNGSTSGLTPWQTYDDDDDQILWCMLFKQRVLWRTCCTYHHKFVPSHWLEQLHQQNRVHLDYDRAVSRVWWNLWHLHKYSVWRNLFNVAAEVIVGVVHTQSKKTLLLTCRNLRN